MRSHVEMFKLELSIQAYSVNRAGKSPEFSFDKKKRKKKKLWPPSHFLSHTDDMKMHNTL